MKNKSKKTVLVTGGAGFIGSHLVERLLKDGHTVISLDNYFTGSRDNHILGAEYREGHTKDIKRHVPEKVDLVFHLGEYSRVEKSFDDMPLVWDLNKSGTFGVLEYCRRHGVKIVYAGSSTKFGLPAATIATLAGLSPAEIAAQAGDGGLGRTQSPYAWSKASNTELVLNYGAWFGVPHAIAYFYNVYGPREIFIGPYATVIGIFKEQHRSGKPLTVVSPGAQKRNFTHVEDIVHGLVLIGEKGEGDGYGLGAEQAHSILEIANMFGGQVTMLPERKGNRMDATLDTSRSQKELGWQARHDVQDYIKILLKR